MLLSSPWKIAVNGARSTRLPIIYHRERWQSIPDWKVIDYRQPYYSYIKSASCCFIHSSHPLLHSQVTKRDDYASTEWPYRCGRNIMLFDYLILKWEYWNWNNEYKSMYIDENTFLMSLWYKLFYLHLFCITATSSWPPEAWKYLLPIILLTLVAIIVCIAYWLYRYENYVFWNFESY